MSATLPTLKKGKAELAEQLSFTPEQVQLMKDTVALGATDNEFLLFMHLAQHYGLDPFLKEIWCIKYGTGPATIFSSRDGYLKIASRDPQMDGIQSDAVYASDTLDKLPDGTVRHSYGVPRGDLVGAYALVFRKDRSRPAYFYAPLKEYNGGRNPTWRNYPSAMIVKVAEAMALKRAFSLSGLVTQEEVGLEMEPQPEPETGAVVLPMPAPTPVPLVPTADSPAKPAAGNAPAATASTSPAPSITSGLSDEDKRKLAGHRTRLLYARSIGEVQQIWQEAKHLRQHLVADKDAAKVRLNQQGNKPTGDGELMREFVTQPTVGMDAPLASQAQREEIQRLLNLPTVLAKEKSDGLLVLHQLDDVRGEQAITKLLLEIYRREGRDGDKEMRQALHRLVGNYAEQLGSSEVDRLTVLYEDTSQHWLTLRAELLAAKASLTAAATVAA